MVASVAFALLLLGMAVPITSTAAADSPALARYPYLTDLTTTSVDVVWATDASDTSDGVVSYGPSGNCGQSIAAAAGAPTSYTAFGEAAPYYQHSVVLKNLSPGTTYCYRIFSGTGSPDTALLSEPPRFPTTFSTLPTSGSFSFDVLGDFGETLLSNNGPQTSYNPYQDALDDQLASSAASPSAPALFAVSTGDVAYPGGSTTNYGDLNHPADGAGGGPEVSGVFDARYWGKVGSSLPLYAVAGNHGRNGVFFSTWPTAANAAASGGVYSGSTPYPSVNGLPAGNYPSDWYAYTVGGVRFYILDADWSDLSQSSYPNLGTACPSNCPSYQADRDLHWQQDSAEYQWLANDLQQDRAARGANALRMAFFHYPLRVDQNNFTTQQDVYLQNSAANPTGGGTSLEALLNNNGVNLVFNGHAHLYQRNVAPPGGVPSYVTGGGGGVPSLLASSACSSTDVYARGWDPGHATGLSCGSPSGSATAKPSAAGQVYHFLKVTVSGTNVTVSPTDSNGAVFDQVTYHFAADNSAPSVPGAPSAVRSAGNVIIKRGAAATDNVGVVAYDIYRDGVYRATIPAGVTSWTDVGVPMGTHSWTVAARDQRDNSSAQSAASGSVAVPDTTPPNTPGPPLAHISLATPHQVSLSWGATTDNVSVSSYQVYRDGMLLLSGLTGNSATDTTAKDITKYTYSVAAVDEAGNISRISSGTSVTTPDWTRPTPPRLFVSAGVPGTVPLYWNGATDNVAIGSYSVYRDGVRVASGLMGGSWTDTGLKVGSTHRYFVVAFDTTGHTSYPSNTMTVSLGLTTAYIASSRQGVAVYINGLIKQQVGSTISRSAGRTIYLQRFINGSWQNVLSRTSDSTGQMAVGFVQTHSYSYRLYVAGSSYGTAAASATTTR